MDFAALFKKAFELGASDIHIRAGRNAALRLHGDLVPVGGGVITPDELLAQIERMVPPHLRTDVAAEAARGLDFSHTDPTAGRFRCSAFKTLGRLGVTMRTIETAIPSLAEL